MVSEKNNTSKYEKSEVKKSTRFKIISGYLILALVIWVSSRIAYDAYNQLIDSVITLSKPDVEVAQMGRVVTNLSEAESKIRLYSLTKEERYLVMYADKIYDIQIDLDSLRAGLKEGSESVRLIDSMNYLLKDRKAKLNRFVKLKKRKSYDKPSQKVIQKLNRSSQKNRVIVKTNSTITTYFDTVTTIVPRERKSRGFLSRIFSGKSTKPLVDSVQTVVRKKVLKVDTSYVQPKNNELVAMKKLWEEAQLKEQLNRDIVGREELRLMEGNTIIWSKIKTLLRQLSQERREQKKRESEQVIEKANSSISDILLIIIVAVLFVIVLASYTLSDIQKSNYYRKQLLKAKRNAEDLAKVKEEFLATMSHEIRTPLNAIIGFTNQLKKTSLISQQKEFVGVIKSSSEHLLGLVNDILDLSKVEAGKLKIENVGFNPSKLVNKVYELLKVSADDKGLDFIENFEGDTDVLLKSDSFRIMQILLNLGANAIKFTSSGSVIINSNLTVVNDRYRLKVDIIDTGIGIAEADKDSIFQAFQQADTFSVRKHGGTGLGLAISKRLAELLGGNITVESELGKGSCFTFDIELDRAEYADMVDADSQIIEQWGQLVDKTFLVADDDEYSLLLIKTIFKSWNFTADFVTDGAKAFQKIQNQTYDMVLTDINMPEMGGIELCSLIREGKTKLPQDVPVVALTANVRKSDIERYLSLGMTDCLEKPFEEKILQQKIAKQFLKESEITYVSQPKEEEVAELLFDMSEIRRFTADDVELEIDILKQFELSANENIEKMEKAFKDDDLLVIGSIAHKMLSSFSQLKVNRAIPILRELEDLLHKNSEITVSTEEIEQRVECLKKVVQAVLVKIREEIQLLVD